MCAVPVSPQVRVPPHDLDAETSVLGAILLDPAAITRVLDQISPDDFYRENNGQIFRAAQNLFREGEPIDNVTLAAELAKLGVLERVGGRAHLAVLQESVPTAANVEHYARIVKDKASKRKLISAGTQVTALGYDEALDADEAVNAAQAQVFAISDDKVGTGMEHIYGLLKPAMDRIDAQMASGGGVIGIPSGFHDLDRMTNGFKAADLAIIAGRPSMGKALSLDTPIPTPTGWTTMGALRVGDQVFDEQGRPCTMVFATPVMVDHDCYEVVFSDGEAIVADAEHQWITWDHSARRAHDDQCPGAASYPYDWPTWFGVEGAARRPVGPRWLPAGGGGVVATRPLLARTDVDAREPITTVQIAATLRSGEEHNHAIPATRALRYPRTTLPVEPYVVGLRLAAGAGLAEGGGIPTDYLLADVEQRLALVHGLVDAAGQVDEHGRYRFITAHQRLADGLVELLTSLGLVPRRRQRPGAESRPIHEVIVASSIPLARLPDKRVAARHRWGRAHVSRSVVDVRPIGSVPVRCIQVDSPSHLYLAGRGCIPTHNTSFVLNVTLYAAVEQKKPVAIFSLEMSKEQLVERMLCEQARIDAQRLHRGTLSDVEYERLAGALGPLGDAPIFIDDAPTLDDLTLRLKARQARSREGIELIVLDYLQLMHGRSRDGDANRVQEVSAISRALKGIARELSIPVIAISQLSRAPEARPDKRPILSDLRESGCLTSDTRIFLPDFGTYRPLADLVGATGFRVLALNTNTWELEPRRVTNSFSTGVKPVFRLTTRLGRTVRATGNHKFLTVDGWKRLDELGPGDRIAVPRRLPSPPEPSISESELALLGHLIGDGCTLPRHSIQYTAKDVAMAEHVAQLAEQTFREEIRPVVRQERSWYQVYLRSAGHLTHGKRNPIAAWFDGLGIFGLRSHEKFVPDIVFRQPRDAVAAFLRHLWATDGCLHCATDGNHYPAVYYATSSVRLARDVQALLLRLEINAKVRRTLQTGKGRDQFHVRVSGQTEMERFLVEVGACGDDRMLARSSMLDTLSAAAENTNRDVLPAAVWQLYVHPAMALAGIGDQALRTSLEWAGRGGIAMLYRQNLSRQRALRIAQAVGSTQLHAMAVGDVYWDEIVSIEPDGEEEVFDLTVDGLHNFTADNIVVHNSIEQDADIVMFLYRDDYYNREKSEKPGIAEVIVAKHRNGPTGVVELIFRRELTRFENMERRRPEVVGPE